MNPNSEFFADQELPVHVAMETESVEIIKAMVASGLGIALVPYVAIAAEVRARRLAWARVRGHRLYREQGWVYLALYLASDYVPPPHRRGAARVR